MNQLYYGDNLEILRRYIRDETVDLIYGDPPFNSKRNYNQIYNNVGKEDRAQAQAFIDTWTWDTVAEKGLEEILNNQSGLVSLRVIRLMDGLSHIVGKDSLLAYLVSMTLRIIEMHRVLKPTGSFYLHCDSSASHYLKIILDAIFCGQGGEYQNEIIWKRSDAKGDVGQGAIHYGRITDTILYYTKSNKATFNPIYTALNEDYIRQFYRYTDTEGRRYKLDNMLGPGGAAKGNPFYEVMGVSRHWRYSRERMQQLIDQGRVIQTNPGTVPMYKRFLDESKGVPVGSLWTDISLIRGHSKEKLGYPTQKPEALLERIIKASSNEGDVVLDAYCGCGTTVAASQRLNRQWIGIDITYQSISLILKRLEDSYGTTASDAVKLTGVPRDFQAAQALAHQRDDRTRKEFEKWAVLTFSQNRAIINEKKGKDGGVDGTAFILDGQVGGTQSMRPILFSVKSNEMLNPTVIRDLNGTIEREKAAMGYLLTLNPMANLVKESKKYGLYTNELFGRTYPKIEVISVHDILKGERIRIPLNQKIDVLKSAKGIGNSTQLGLF